MSVHPAIVSCLQVFMAVVENNSFSKASRVMNITQSAVSHRIKQLEDIIGVPLINRTTRYIKVTNDGERLYQEARILVSDIEIIVGSFKPKPDAPLTLTTISSLATMWLMPNLSSYNDQHAGQPLSVLTDDTVLDLKYEGVDAAIRLTATIDPTLDMTFICDEWTFPVASTALVSEPDIINNPQQLLKYPLLFDIVAEKGNDESSWHGWFTSQGLSLPIDKKGQNFNRTDTALQAVSAGQGMAMARASLIEISMLKMGLYKQVGRAVRMKYAYYFVCSPEKSNTPSIINLRNWLVEEMQKSSKIVTAALLK